MDAQTLIVTLIVGCALGYLGRRLWRMWRGGAPPGCGGCRCGGTTVPEGCAHAATAPRREERG